MGEVIVCSECGRPMKEETKDIDGSDFLHYVCYDCDLEWFPPENYEKYFIR